MQNTQLIQYQQNNSKTKKLHMERLFHPMMCIFLWYGYICNDHHTANHWVKSQVDICCKATDESREKYLRNSELLFVALSFLESEWEVGRTTELTNI